MHYVANRLPLQQTRFVHLPLGATRPEGWLRHQLLIQADGLSGYVYSAFDAPTWADRSNYEEGIVALAYVLNDQRLEQIAKAIVDRVLASPPRPQGMNVCYQHRMRMLIEYHEATSDVRVILWLTSYFEEIADTPLSRQEMAYGGDKDRAGEHLIPAYWLYNRTGNPKILEAIRVNFRSEVGLDNIERAVESFLSPGRRSDFWNNHSVTLAQAIKFPGLLYQQFPETRYEEAVFHGIDILDQYCGQVGGRYAGHEHLPESNGHSPANGTELCTVAEQMYSMQRLFEIYGDVRLADRIEYLMFNSHPGTCTPDMWTHQYDQQANQVSVSVAERVFDNSDTANIYGLVPHYPCCLSNMHQSWPRFVEYLWMATHDNGLATVAYAPSRVTAKAGTDGDVVTIIEETDYPFGGEILFRLKMVKPVVFPLHLRIPSWAHGTTIVVDEEEVHPKAGSIYALKRSWRNDDVVRLVFPMKVRVEERHRRAVSILRGPLYFCLRIGQEYRECAHHARLIREQTGFPVYDWEIHPTTPWNYGLIVDCRHPERSIEVVTHEVARVPFAQRGEPLFRREDPDTLPNSAACVHRPMPAIAFRRVECQHKEPVILKVKGRLIPSWKMASASAADPPESPVQSDQPIEDLELIPYGCTRLRISEFPVTVN